MNSDLSAYFDTLCDGKYPKFIDKYLECDEFKRLDRVGMFCGCDYTSLFTPRFWYSRLDHSISTALMTYHFTGNKQQTILALFHDLGTPAFSHCVDFMLGDAKNQSKSEKSVKDVVFSSDKLKNMLLKDKVPLDIFDDYESYPVVENKKPKVCVDRLDGIFSLCLILMHTHSLEQISEVYKNMKVLRNEFGEEEIGFLNTQSAEKFYELATKYTIEMQDNEDKMVMQFIADNLRLLINRNKIQIEDLYKLGEQEILSILKRENGENLKAFNYAKKLRRSEEPDPMWYSVSVEAKKRYVLPIVKCADGRVVRLHTVSEKCKKMFDYILSYKDSKYCYIPNIKHFI
ncbi:MAG: hypothetical protein J6J23_03750 [Clostridia bacterium]|nr:hypothetical protein [Clostridia bacterium]